MLVESCVPVIPSADLEKSLRFWVDGLGLTMNRPMHREGKLIGCMVQNDHMYLWLNEREGPPVPPAGFDGIRLYLAPDDIRGLHGRLKGLGFSVSEIEDRDYGQTEFFVTDDDGFSHSFGVGTSSLR